MIFTITTVFAVFLHYFILHLFWVVQFLQVVYYMLFKPHSRLHHSLMWFNSSEAMILLALSRSHLSIVVASTCTVSFLKINKALQRIYTVVTAFYLMCNL